jgi:hypothetical protein
MAMLMPAPPEPSILEEIFQGLFGLLVFRDIEFEAGSITDGSVEAGLQDLRIHAQEIEVLLSKDSPLRAIGHLSISWPSMHIERLVSDLSIRTENAPSFEKTTNRYHIKTEDTSLMVTGAELQGADMEAELSYDSNAKKITVDPLDLRVGGIQLEGLLGESSRGGPPVGIQGADLKAKLSFSMNQRECVFDSVQLRLKAVSLGDRKGEKAPPSDLRLSYKGTLDLDDSRLSLSQLDVEMGELIDVKGALEGAYSPGPEISLEIREGRLWPGNLLNFLSGGLLAPQQSLRIEGPASLKGRVRCVGKWGGWNWSGDMKAALHDNHLVYSDKGIVLSGAVTGDIRVEGTFPDLEIVTGLECKNALFSGWEMNQVPFRASASASAKPPEVHIHDLRIQIPRLKLQPLGIETPIDRLRIHLKGGRFSGDKQSVFLPEIHVDSSLFTMVELSFDRDPRQINVQLEGEDCGLLRAMSKLKLSPEGWKYQGRESFTIKARKQETRWVVSSQISLTDFAFQNEDESAVGEGISMASQIEGRLSEERGSCAFRTSIRMDKGEVLYDRFYMDHLNHPFVFQGEGEIDFEQDRLILSDVGLALQDILSLNIDGSVAWGAQNRHARLAIGLPPISLEPIFRQFVLDPFKTEKPFLSSFRVGGDLSADLELSGGPANWVMRGMGRWHRGTFSSGADGMAVAGLHLNLPLWYESQKRENERNQLEGRLSVDSLTLPFIPRQALDITLPPCPTPDHECIPDPEIVLP